METPFFMSSDRILRLKHGKHRINVQLSLHDILLKDGLAYIEYRIIEHLIITLCLSEEERVSIANTQYFKTPMHIYFKKYFDSGHKLFL